MPVTFTHLLLFSHCALHPYIPHIAQPDRALQFTHTRASSLFTMPWIHGLHTHSHTHFLLRLHWVPFTLPFLLLYMQPLWIGYFICPHCPSYTHSLLGLHKLVPFTLPCPATLPYLVYLPLQHILSRHTPYAHCFTHCSPFHTHYACLPAHMPTPFFTIPQCQRAARAVRTSLPTSCRYTLRACAGFYAL